MNQANRIMAGSRGNQARVDRVRNTAFRYYDNIRRQGSFNSNRESSYSQSYSRRQYMGLSNG